MTYAGKWLMVIFLSCLCALSMQAQQPERYLEFSLEELSAVDVDKPLLPIKVDSTYVTSGNTINIGYLLPISGYPRFTKELINSCQLAIEEINNYGGVAGKKIVLIPADIGATEDFILQRASSLIDNYNTRLFMGPTSSDALINLSNQLLPQKDFMIVSATATSPAISLLADRGLIFRTCPSDAIQGKQAAKFSHGQLKAQKAAILYPNNYYGRALADVFAEEFKQEGGQILNMIRFNPLINLENYDMTPKLDSLISGKPDMIYVIGLAKNFSDISHQMADNELFINDDRPTIVMSDGARGEDLVEQGNLTVLDGMYGFYLPFTGNKIFAEKYEKKYRQQPFSLASEYTYDIVYLMALAILEARSTDPVMVSSHLTSVSKNGIPVSHSDFLKARKLISKNKAIDYNGITGKLEFNETGEVNERRFGRWKLIEGEIKYFDDM